MSDQDDGMIVVALQSIAQAAGRVLPEDSRNWCQGSMADCAIFSYRQNFPLLWGLEAGGLDGIAQSLLSRDDREYTVVIVWDGQPEDTAADAVAVGRYVTPYDWAAALSLSLYHRYARKPGGSKPKIRILIFDIASYIFSAEDLFVQRSLFASHNAFPWIQAYRPVEANDDIAAEYVIDEKDHAAYALVRQAIPPSRFGARHLIEDIFDPQRVLTTFKYDDSHLAAIKAFAESWSQQFLKAGSRHDVANLLGPLLLAQGLPDTIRETILTKALPRRALQDLIGQIGLLGEPPGQRVYSTGLQPDGGMLGRRKGVRLLLVDDQYRLGYQHILGHTIFGNDYNPEGATISDDVWQYKSRSGIAELKCVLTWSFLLDAFPAEEIDDWAMPRRLLLPDCDVLLLDLRLWLEGQTDLRSAFMLDLIAVCQRLGTQKINDAHLTRSFDSAKGLAAQNVAGRSAGQAEPAGAKDPNQSSEISELPALALLPLLLSHYDPSLPIVLFSSTHQREVLEMVGHRPNIITGFSKPLLTGYGTGQRPEDSIRGLAAAMRRAVELHESRLVWEKLCDADWQWRPPFKVFADTKKEKTYNTADGSDNEHRPTPSGVNLRRRLKHLYVDYLLRGAYYDFSSASSELIEGALIPDAVQKQPQNSGFRLEFKSGEGYRNRLAEALRTIRHRKVHGHANPPAGKQREEWRIASIVIFLVLLDYMEKKTESIEKASQVRLADSVQNFWQSLTKKHGVALGRPMRYWPNAAPPNLLTSCRDLPWLPFVVYTVFHAMKDAGTTDEGNVPFSKTTWDAVCNLVSDFFQ